MERRSRPVLSARKVPKARRGHKARKEIKVIQAQRGLLVLPGQPATSVLLGPRVLQESPVQLANRVRLVMLEQ